MNTTNFDNSSLKYKIEHVTKHSIELSWETREGLVEYWLTPAGDNSDLPLYKGPDNNFTHLSLKSSTEYSYFLSGKTADNKTTLPVLIIARTAVRDTPIPPTFFREFGQTDTQVSFFWDDGIVDGGIPRYEIRRDGELLENPSAPPYTDTDPQQGRNHVYCIRTIDDEFYYSEARCIEVYFEDFTAPTDPSELKFSELSVKLSWEASFDSSLIVFYDVDKGAGDVLVRTAETEIVLTDLDGSEKYNFGVTAIDQSGNKSNRVAIDYPVTGVSVRRKL